ncbi:MAG: hypothetical protein DMG58_19265 [Acidobacteria bacterium]|nr:MAG: hypothetical protein DMG58_19265 [Acidobacteriota bacterium]
MMEARVGIEPALLIENTQIPDSKIGRIGTNGNRRFHCTSIARGNLLRVDATRPRVRGFSKSFVALNAGGRILAWV